MRSASPDGSERHKFVNLQAGRGIAALLVVMYHVDRYYFGNPSYWPSPIFGHLFAFGHAGVEFFFVLSGFIIYMVHWRDIGRASALPSFLKKRFVRIYPFYWLCLAMALALFLLTPGIGLAKNRDPVNIVGSILLAGITPTDATIFVSWTLFHEILFYAVFAVLILSRRIGWAVLGLWLALCAGAWLALDPVPYPFGLINLLFGMGIGAAMLFRHGRVPAPGLVCALGAALFLATGVDEVFGHLLSAGQTILSYGAGSTLILAGALELERGGVMRAPAPLVLCGEASYAIYLTHMLALGFGAKALHLIHATRWLPPVAGFVLLALLGLAVGIVAHLLVERPLLRAAQRWVGLAKPRGGPDPGDEGHAASATTARAQSSIRIGSSGVS